MYFTSVACVIRRDLGTYSVGRGVAALSSEAASSSSVSGLEAGGGVGAVPSLSKVSRTSALLSEDCMQNSG